MPHYCRASPHCRSFPPLRRGTWAHAHPGCSDSVQWPNCWTVKLALVASVRLGVVIVIGPNGSSCRNGHAKMIGPAVGDKCDRSSIELDRTSEQAAPPRFEHVPQGPPSRMRRRYACRLRRIRGTPHRCAVKTAGDLMALAPRGEGSHRARGQRTRVDAGADHGRSSRPIPWGSPASARIVRRAGAGAGGHRYFRRAGIFGKSAQAGIRHSHGAGSAFRRCTPDGDGRTPCGLLSAASPLILAGAAPSAARFALARVSARFRRRHLAPCPIQHTDASGTGFTEMRVSGSS